MADDEKGWVNLEVLIIVPFDSEDDAKAAMSDLDVDSLYEWVSTNIDTDKSSDTVISGRVVVISGEEVEYR